jgi:predicted RNA binding protein with dsRBD fold (UPF0201 family)
MFCLLAYVRMTENVSVVAQAVLLVVSARDLQVAGRRGREMLMRLLRVMELLMIDIVLDC